MQRVAGKMLFQTDQTALRLLRTGFEKSALLDGVQSKASQNAFKSSTNFQQRLFSSSNLGGLQSEKQFPATSKIINFSFEDEVDKKEIAKRPLESKETSKQLKVEMACAAVIEMAKDVAGNREKVEKAVAKSKDADPTTVQRIQVLESDNVGNLDTGAILATLKAFNTILGPVKAGSVFAVQNLENTIMWRARNCSMRELTLLLSFSVKYRPDTMAASQTTAVGATETRSLLYKEVVKSLERRWVEITDGRTFISVMHYPECFSNQFIGKLEDRMIEVAENLPAADLILILKDLGAKRRRSVPLLRAVLYHLMRSLNDLDLKTISDCLFALKELSFKDIDFLDSICHVAGTKLPETSEKVPLVLRSVLTSLGQMRYRPTILLDMMTEKMIEHESELQNKDLIAFLVTTATLNYVPKNSDKLYKMSIERLTPASLFSDTSKGELLWLDIVWSLAVVGKVSPDHLKSVLCADFYNRLLYSHDHRNVGIILKLLNVNGVAQNILTDYNGPTITVSDDPLLRDVKLLVKSDRTKLVSSIMESFEGLAAPPNFLSKDVNTLMGFHLDGEAIFDANLKPLHISEYETFASKSSALGQTNTLKPLPQDAHRVAILIVGFHDCLVGSLEFSGLTSLCIRLLESQSYKTLIIRHDDLKPQHKKLDRIKILEQKLKNLLAVNKES